MPRVGRTPMKTLEQDMGINKDQVEGRAKEVAGKVQEVAGRATGSATQELKGKVKQGVGAAQAGFGDAKEHIKDDVKDHARAREDAQRDKDLQRGTKDSRP
jgi:uncharacterized protein YjbJ (UPF0337 family)